MVKILGITVIGCLISVLIRQYCKEFLLIFQLAIFLIIALVLYDSIFDKLKSFTEIIKSFSMENEMFYDMLKAAFVSVAAKIGCDICRESNNVLIEGIIDIGARMTILILSFPYILNIINIALEYL